MNKWNPMFPKCLKKGCESTDVREVSRESGVSIFACASCGTKWKVTEPGSRLETVTEELAS